MKVLILANPITVRSVAGDWETQLLITIFALVAESLVVARLAGRKQWLADAGIWLALTGSVWICFILLLTGWLQWNPRQFSDVLDARVFGLELGTVCLEAFFLWLLWLRAAGSAFYRALLISFIGNAVSFGVSILGLSLTLLKVAV